MFGVVNPVSRAPRELPGSIEEAPSSFEPDVRRLLRAQVHATLSRMVDELVGEEGREGAVRVLGSVESYAAAMRGVLADLSEPAGPRRRGGYSGGLGDVGMEIPGPNFGGPPGTDGFLGDLVETVKDALGKQIEANRDGAIEHKLQTLTATASRLQGLRPGPVREQLQAMLDDRMGELQDTLSEGLEDEAPAPPGTTVLETGTLPWVDGADETPATGAAGGADEAPPHDHFPEFTGPTFPASAPPDDF